VLAPTREIAVQIQQVVCAIGSAIPHLHCQTFIGGLPLSDDVAKLKKCHIAVGTPGNVLPFHIAVGHVGSYDCLTCSHYSWQPRKCFPGCLFDIVLLKTGVELEMQVEYSLSLSI